MNLDAVEMYVAQQGSTLRISSAVSSHGSFSGIRGWGANSSCSEDSVAVLIKVDLSCTSQAGIVQCFFSKIMADTDEDGVDTLSALCFCCIDHG